MTSAMMAFTIAVGGTSLACFVLMRRLQNRNRRSPSDGRSPDGGNYATGDGWTMASWFSGNHSALDGSGNPSDCGGGDGGGGGGGDGGGGGGD